ncbi:MAG: UbiA family prenyltransferase [Jiangellaceae bacterium]
MTSDTGPVDDGPGSVEQRVSVPGRVRGLLLACHPLPAAAVTSLTVALAAVAGVRGVVLATLGAAVLAGQVCVGWVNDLVDRDLDRASARTDKPVAAGRVGVRDVGVAALGAGVACVPLSLALGTLPGACHLIAVVAALVYDVGLKRTVWSWVPYAVGFGLLPVVVWLVSPAGEPPPAWMVAAGASLGVGSHGANVLPDHTRDRAAGVMGLPQRLGAQALRTGTAAALLTALGLLILGPAGSPPAWEWAAFAAGALLMLVAVLPSAGNRAAFPAAIGVGALAVAVLFVRSTLG